MEPRQAGSGQPLERQLPHPQSGESYNFPPTTPELTGERSYEAPAQQPAPIEAEGPVPVLPTLPAPLPQVDDAPTQVVATDDSSVPVTAADDDLIEKEWVDKAKKIIEDTKEDPYRRELEISRLQREYIRKRYGREIGEPSTQ